MRTGRGHHRTPPPWGSPAAQGDPPSRSSLAPEVSVHHAYGRPRADQPGSDLLGHHDATVLPAGAAHRKHHEVLPLALVAVQGHPHGGDVGIKELSSAGLAEDVLLDVIV